MFISQTLMDIDILLCNYYYAIIFLIRVNAVYLSIFELIIYIKRGDFQIFVNTILKVGTYIFELIS